MLMRMPIITLLSDFGLKDPYVAEIKAVILSICPNAIIVDISHEVRKFDTRMGAFILAQAAQYFPEGTIHVAVVDPGVGTERRPIIVETSRSLYVGPDNGVLMLSALKEEIHHIYKIANPKYMLKRISRTFHGRDIFSCSAAHLANGVPPHEFGPEVDNPIMPEYIKPRVEGDEIVGEVIHIDDFGNIITNISLLDLKKLGIQEGETLQVRLKGKILSLRLCSAYGEAPQGEPLFIIGSSDFLEVAINQGNAAKAYDAKTGDLVKVDSFSLAISDKKKKNG